MPVQSKPQVPVSDFVTFISQLEDSNEDHRMFSIVNYLSTHDVSSNGRTKEIVELLKRVRGYRGQLTQKIKENQTKMIVRFSQKCADAALRTFLTFIENRIPILYGSRATWLSNFYRSSPEFLEEVSESIDWDIGYNGPELPDREGLEEALNRLILPQEEFELGDYQCSMYTGSFGCRTDPAAGITVFCEIMVNLTDKMGTTIRSLVKRENVLDISLFENNNGLEPIDSLEHPILPSHVLVQSPVCYMLGLVDIIVKNKNSKEIVRRNKAGKANRRLQLLNFNISYDDIMSYKDIFTGLRELDFSEIMKIIGES